MAYYATYQQDETGVLQKVVINAGVGFVLPFLRRDGPARHSGLRRLGDKSHCV